jgi:hypothetical protein
MRTNSSGSTAEKHMLAAVFRRTASHYLLKLMAIIGGIGSSNLEYGLSKYI